YAAPEGDYAAAARREAMKTRDVLEAARSAAAQRS
ncbi:MAG: orotidine 5'-phosphate decarboxylase, partial [Comamonadaceae bacterium]